MNYLIKLMLKTLTYNTVIYINYLLNMYPIRFPYVLTSNLIIYKLHLSVSLHKIINFIYLINY